MSKITKNTDADTFRVDGVSTRVLGINTEESVAVNEERNTEKGKIDSARAKNILPKGAPVRTETEEAGTGTFGRDLRDLKLQTAEGEVDYGLLALDQSMSKYTTKYGEHPDPEQHDIFKEYFSDKAPYQADQTKEHLTQKEYKVVADNIAAFEVAEKAYEKGNISREDFDKSMYKAYGDGQKVARYRYMNHDWQKKVDMENYDGSEKMAWAWALQGKENKDTYNKSIKNSHTGAAKNPEKDPGFWKSFTQDSATMFSTFNDFAILGRSTDLDNARKYGSKNLDIPDKELLMDVPTEYHDQVLQEAEKYGDGAARQFRENLLIDIKNEEDLAEMHLGAQIALAIPAILTSPVTLIPGMGAAKGVGIASKTISQVLGKGAMRYAGMPLKATVASGAGFVEAGVSALPRLANNETFTPEDMLMEMKFGAAFGGAIPVLAPGIKGAAKWIGEWHSGMNAFQKAMQAEVNATNAGFKAEPTLSAPKANVIDTNGRIQLVDEIDASEYLATRAATNAGSTTPVKIPVLDGDGYFNIDVLEGRFKYDQRIVEDATGIRVESKAELDELFKPKTAPIADSTPKPLKVLTQDDLDYIAKEKAGTPQVTKTPEEAAEIKDVHNKSRKALKGQAEINADELLNDFTPIPYKRSKTGAVVDTATAGVAKSMTQTMLESSSKVSQFIGAKLLELPEGMGGKIIREHSAALQQHSLRTRYLSDTMPQYHKLVSRYAAEKGKKWYGKFMAQHMDSQSNKSANAFSLDVARVLEQRRQGHTVTVDSPAVLEMVDSFDKSMTTMYDDLVDSGVSGFRSERRIKNYFPQMWDDGGIRGAISKYGRDRVERLLSRGYINSQHNSINSMAEAMHTAKKFMKDMEDGNVADGAMPATIDSRAKTRLDIDTTTVDGDLAITDMMNTDLSTLMSKYSNRAAGQIALANKGIRSELDIDALRQKTLRGEGKAAVETPETQLFDDAMNIVMGRPTRDGLDPGLNEIKDAVAQTKMGGLGMAQAAELGNVLARSVMQLVNDPKAFAKVWAMAGESTKNKQLMNETQALSGVTNEVHLIDRQASHLDRNEMQKISKVRDTAHWVAGKATFGKYKAPAGYALAQASGFNMIRRFERRVANASFMIDTAKTFKDGTGVMSKERMKDIGLDPDDANLKRIFRDVVDYDENGVVKKLNIDQWDKATRENYSLAMYRDDAQMVQQQIGGENSRHLNRPAMTLIAQFKQSALLANKKQLTRSMQFADKEAVLGTLLNTAMAGLTRTAKFGTLGAGAYAVTGNESELNKKPWELEYWEPEKYVAQFGFFPDMGHIAYDSYKAYDEDSMSVQTATEGVAREIPMLGWFKDYADIGINTAQGDIKGAAESTKGIALLGNLQFSDWIFKGVSAQLED